MQQKAEAMLEPSGDGTTNEGAERLAGAAPASNFKAPSAFRGPFLEPFGCQLIGATAERNIKSPSALWQTHHRVADGRRCYCSTVSQLHSQMPANGEEDLSSEAAWRIHLEHLPGSLWTQLSS